MHRLDVRRVEYAYSLVESRVFFECNFSAQRDQNV